MIVWLVFREAVYRHECLGIFASFDAAKSAALAAAENELDSHHAIEVRGPWHVDQRTPFEKPANDVRCENPDYKEPTVVFSVTKPKAPVT
jgi:hypothetical protein